MMYLITGGSGSGKSQYAEDLAVNIRDLYQKKNLFYLAAMMPGDEESRERIRRHRHQRAGRGFTTIECYDHIEQIQIGAEEGSVYLLECLSNLLANEMYAPAGRITDRGGREESQTKKAVLRPLLELAKQADLIVVSNEVFSDGVRYDPDTMCYLRLLGFLNCSLAKEADAVVETVCAIPLIRKGELPC